MVPLLKVEWLRKPFEGVIAMRDTCFESEVETAGVRRGGNRAGAATFPLLAGHCGGHGERGDPAWRPAAFNGGQAPGRVGGTLSKRSN